LYVRDDLILTDFFRNDGRLTDNLFDKALSTSLQPITNLPSQVREMQRLHSETNELEVGTNIDR